MTLREIARAYYDAGLNVLPALKAQKRPVGAWKKHTTKRPSFDEVFPENGKSFDALCVVCGSTSGGLEIIDFDLSGRLYPPFRDSVGDAVSDYVVETTQRGGIHFAYRASNCGRNQKLATVADGCAIETRGEGGICIIAPTPGYELLYGCWERVPTISDEQRNELLDLARSYDEAPAAETINCVTKRLAEHPHQQTLSSSSPYYGESAADYVKRIEAGKDALLRHGWTHLYDDATWEYWARPGQTVPDKVGGEWHKEDRYFHVFSSNAAPLEPGGSYSHLQLLALLDFDGDVSAASRHWSKQTDRAKSVRVIETYDPEFGEFGYSNEVRRLRDPLVEEIPFPNELYNCGGMLQEIQELSNELAIRPQPEGAFLGALCSLSYLTGRTLTLNYASTLVTTNIYGLFLAPSGMGKEAIRRVAAEISKTYNPTEPAPESFASVQALQNMIARVRKIFWIHDEFGRDLAVMANVRNNSNISGVITESLKLYSNANNTSYLPKLIAQEAKGVNRPEPVDRPSLTIFATGNQKEYYAAASDALLSNGYVARFTTIEGRTYSEKRATTYEEATSNAPFALGASFKSRIKAWRDMELQAENTPFVIPFTKGAFDVIKGYDDEVEKQIKEATYNGDTSTEMMARTFEKVWKYALLFTASKYGPTSTMVVEQDSAELAVLLLDYEMRKFRANADRFNDTEQSKFLREIVDWIETLGRTAFNLSQFTRKFQRRRKQEREEALDTLLDIGYLEAIDGPGRKKIYEVKDDVA